MSALDKVTAHFDSINITKEIKVPEWNLTIYFTAFTLSEKRTLIKLSKGDDIEFVIRVLIMKSLDKKGNPVFDMSDKPTLMGHADTDVIARIVNLISKVKTPKEVEEK